MKILTLLSFLVITSSSFAATSIDKCVDAAMEGARASLTVNENLDARKLFVEEKGMFIDGDAQYLQTRKELTTLCRRLYIATIELPESL